MGQFEQRLVEEWARRSSARTLLADPHSSRAAAVRFEPGAQAPGGRRNDAPRPRSGLRCRHRGRSDSAALQRRVTPRPIGSDIPKEERVGAKRSHAPSREPALSQRRSSGTSVMTETKRVAYLVSGERSRREPAVCRGWHGTGAGRLQVPPRGLKPLVGMTRGKMHSETRLGRSPNHLYSARMIVVGSKRMARSAGTTVPASAVTKHNAPAVKKVTPSAGFTPASRLSSSLAAM